MRPLRYSINVTLDGCCDHRVMIADEDLHRHAVENLDRADALLFGRVTYEMMVAGWREVLRTGAGRPGWMMPFARKIDGMKKYVVSATLKAVDRNSELCCKSRKRELALQKRSSAIYRKRNRTDSRAAPRKCTTALRLPLWDILSPAYDARHEPAPGRGEE